MVAVESIVELATALTQMWMRDSCLKSEETGESDCTHELESNLNVGIAGTNGIINLLLVCYTISMGLEEESSTDDPEMERSFTVRSLTSASDTQPRSS